MPFAATKWHQYWTVDVRYLGMHQLGGGMIYVITILENVSRAILASTGSRSQDLTAYLMMLYAAIRQHGIPEALVSDSGGVVKAKEARRIYGEHGLARQQAAVWLYGETLLLEFSDEPLAQYCVAHAPDHRHLRDIVPRQLFETQYRSPQLPLWELGDGEWLKVVRVPPATLRRQRKDAPRQQLLLIDLSRA